MGTEIWIAEEKKSGEKVEVKKIYPNYWNAQGISFLVMREISIMKRLQHDNIVSLIEVLGGSELEEEAVERERFDSRKDCTFLIFEYAQHDLGSLMRFTKDFRFTVPQVKCLMKQILSGVQHFHRKGIIHRDLKPGNLLLNEDGTLIISDFFLAKEINNDSRRPYLPEVETLQNRAPEILLGTSKYGQAVDMWSVGCVMLEMLTGRNLFNGNDDFSMLQKIFYRIGNPNEETWPSWRDVGINGSEVKLSDCTLNLSATIKQFHGDLYTPTYAMMDLLRSLLSLNPNRRITASEALAHDWFQETPEPCHPRIMSKMWIEQQYEEDIC